MFSALDRTRKTVGTPPLHCTSDHLLNEHHRNLREVQEILGHARFRNHRSLHPRRAGARRESSTKYACHDPEMSRAALQTLFVSARAWDVTALLRDLKESTRRWQKVKLETFILGLLEFGKAGPALGLKPTIEGGRGDLSTTTVTDPRLSASLCRKFHE